MEENRTTRTRSSATRPPRRSARLFSNRRFVCSAEAKALFVPEKNLRHDDSSISRRRCSTAKKRATSTVRGGHKRARVATRPTAMRARASALLARATLFAFALLAPTPAACHGFYEPGDEALPESVLLESHDVAYPRDVGTFSLADFDHTRNSDGKKFVTVVATFYTGCTPGRQDYPSLTRVVTQLHAQTAGGHLPGNVAFVASLKNGVHAGVAEAWANLPGADVSVAGNNSGFPYLVDDRHRALVYKFFDAAIHPAYAVIDHCMRFRRLLPALTRQEPATASKTSSRRSSARQPPRAPRISDAPRRFARDDPSRRSSPERRRRRARAFRRSEPTEPSAASTSASKPPSRTREPSRSTQTPAICTWVTRRRTR